MSEDASLADPDAPGRASVLPPERVGRGAALALVTVPVTAAVTGVIWKLGFGGWVTAVLVAPCAAFLYARGSGGRVAKAVRATAITVVVAVVVSFFTVVAVDLWGYYYDKLAAEMASVYGSRWGFVKDNLFYPVLLEKYRRTALELVALGVLGEVVTVLRVVRLNRAQRSAGG